MKRALVVTCAVVLAVGASVAVLARQGRQGGPAQQIPQNQPGQPWPTYGGNLASHRYSPLDQINKDNFKNLELAWRFRTDNYGPNPAGLDATPLYVNGVLYSTVGARRAVVALNPATAEVIWMHSQDEGLRGQNAPRQGAGRGLSYWSSANGADQRIIYVTPGYRMVALNAKTGVPVPTFGKDGVVDLKQENDQVIDLVTGEIGLNSTPLVAGDVVVVGAAHRSGGAPPTMRNVKGYVRGFDARTGKRLWIFHTLPQKGEPGYETWEDESALRNGNLGVWGEMSADLDLGLVYVPTEMPTGDYYGGNRPGDNLYADSILALDLKTGKRKWHYQTVHHDIWDWDLPCAPLLYDMQVNGKTVKVLAQPTKQAWLFVLNRETGAPIWPIEERPVEQSTAPNEKTSRTQPFPTRPAPYDRQGVSVDDLIDFTPALRAQALELVKAYKLGPIFTPPVLSSPDGPLATLMAPGAQGGANWAGGAFDPETNRLYIHSHSVVTALGLVPAGERSDMGYIQGTARAGGPAVAAPAEPGEGPAPGRGGAGRAGGQGAGRGAGGRGGGPAGAPGAGGRGAGGSGRGGTAVSGLPLLKPPYDRITAYDMNTGNMLWQKAHSSTADNIKNNPALKGLNLPRLGASGSIILGVLPTKTLLIAGDGGVHTNAAGETVALLRAYDKATGEDIPAEINMPAPQTGSPMTYMHNGKQYIVLAVSGTGTNSGGQLLAYALP